MIDKLIKVDTALKPHMHRSLVRYAKSQAVDVSMVLRRAVRILLEGEERRKTRRGGPVVVESVELEYALAARVERLAEKLGPDPSCIIAVCVREWLPKMEAREARFSREYDEHQRAEAEKKAEAIRQRRARAQPRRTAAPRLSVTV